MNPGNEKSSQRKVFDVARPGKTPAHASSRPVVGSRHAVRDMDIADRPLMNPKQKITVAPQPSDEAAAPEAPSEELSKTQKAPTEEIPPAKPQEMPSVPPLDEALAAKIKSELAVASSDSDGPERPPELPRTEPTAPDEPVEPPVQSSPPEVEPSSEPLHMGMPHDLSQDGNIVVSHHRKRHTFLKELLATVVIVAIIAAIANLLLDAGIIATELDLPHTDFFAD